MQAALSSPEIDTVVVEPTVLGLLEGSSGCVLRRWHTDTTGVQERGMCVQGVLGNLGEPIVSLPTGPED